MKHRPLLRRLWRQIALRDTPHRLADVPAHPLHTIAILTLIIVAQTVFTTVLLRAHYAYRSNAFDFGFFDQIIWNTSQGRWFETTFISYNFLGQHFEPVLLIFAAAYRIRPWPEMMLVAQAAAVAWAALPLYLAARRILASAIAGLLIAAAYLMAPHLHGALLFDFHPEVMGMLPLFGACALLVAGRTGWAILALASLLLLKEDAALAIVSFAGILWWWGRRRTALIVAGGALLYVAVVAGVVMPAARAGHPGDLQERYLYLTDAADSPRALLQVPGRIIRHLTYPPQLRATVYLVGTTAFMALRTPVSLAAAPLLAANLLSTHPPQNTLSLHYVSFPFALMFIGAVWGTRAAAGRLPRRSRRLPPAVIAAGLLLAATLIAWIAGSPLGPRRVQVSQYQRTTHHAAISRMLHMIPEQAAVSAQSGIVPHLSQRVMVYEFPDLRQGEYVLISRQEWRSSQSVLAGYDVLLARLGELGFCRIAEDDGVELYRLTRGCG